MAHAVAGGAGFCVCTCCFMSNRQISLPSGLAGAAQQPAIRGAAPARLPMEMEMEMEMQMQTPVEGDRDMTRRPPRGGEGAADGVGAQTVSRDAWLDVATAEMEALLRLAELQARAESDLLLLTTAYCYILFTATYYLLLTSYCLLQASPESARSAAHTVNALRAAAAERRWDARWGAAAPAAGGSRAQPRLRAPRAPRLRVEIKCFERKFSPRNFVLVGQPVWHANGSA